MAWVPGARASESLYMGRGCQVTLVEGCSCRDAAKAREELDSVDAASWRRCSAECALG